MTNKQRDLMDEIGVAIVVSDQFVEHIRRRKELDEFRGDEMGLTMDGLQMLAGKVDVAISLLCETRSDALTAAHRGYREIDERIAMAQKQDH